MRKFQKDSTILSGAIVCAVLGVANPAHAQTPEAPETETAAATPAGEIVVTARRREETLVSVPVVVSVLSEQDLARNNASDLTRIGEMTPTVVIGTYKSNGGGSLAIRGISSPANQTGFEQAVSVAIDGVQTSDGRIAQLGFFDIQQVEVLKGPQALFFGKNSPAGVISIKTADPGRDAEYILRAGYEFVGDEYSLEGVASVPLSDTFGVRLAVKYRNLDGWLRNTAQPLANPFYRPLTGAPIGASQLPGTSDTRPGDKEFLGRLTIKGELSPNLTARLKLFYAKSEDDGPGVATQNIGPCTGPNPRTFGAVDPAADCVIDRRTSVGDLPPVISQTFALGTADGTPYGDFTVYTGSLDLDWNLGNISVASISGYNSTKYLFFSGLDQTSLSQVAFSDIQRNEAFSQELRLTSDFDGFFNFMLGGYYQKSELNDANDVKLSDANYVAAANRYVSYADKNSQKGSTLSVFGQAIFDITDQLELAGGLRFTRETKKFSKQNTYGIGAFNTLTTLYPGETVPGFLTGTYKDNNFSPEVTLSYRPSSTKTIFAAYKTGYKSGGFGLTSPLLLTTRIGDADFDAEKARGFEVGAKGVFLNNRLRLNAALFSFKFSNLQVNTFDPVRFAFTINNASSVKQRGFEIDGNFQVNDNLTIRGAIAHVNARFNQFLGQCFGYAFPAGTVRATATPPAPCTFVNATALTLQQDYTGRAPARSPDWAGNAGFTLSTPVGSHKAELTGDAFYSGSYFAAETMAPSTLQDDFWRFNASLSLSEADDRYAIRLVGRNLTNKYYLIYAADRTGGTGVPLTIGEQRGVVSRGREIALQLQTRF